MTRALMGIHQSKARYHVAFISRNPSQWQGPLFARIAASENIHPHVYYLSAVGLGTKRETEMGAVPDWGTLPVLEGYEHTFVERSWRGVVGLLKELVTQRYDALVLEGYREVPLMFAIAWALLTRTPRFLRIDSILMYEQEKPNWQRKQRLMPFLRRGFTGFLPLSSLTVQYLQHLGVPAERIFLMPYTVRNEWYAQLADDWRSRRQAVRAELGLPLAIPVVVAVLRFVERERPLDLLQALKKLQQRNLAVGAILIGDGPQRAEIDDFVRANDLRDVVMPGFLPLSDLPKFFAVADLFVHPAVEECWGLSVNEAMACGLPVIASDRVGAAYDLMRDGQTGMVYRAGNIDQLADCIERLCVDEIGRQRMGAQARDYVHNVWNYEKSVSALQTVLEQFLD